jgi:putative transposase
MAGFVDFYNHRHRHIGIGLHTPADVHFGHANDTHAVRVATLKAAHRSRPERFGKPGTPKILDLPERVYINPPKEDETDAA